MKYKQDLIKLVKRLNSGEKLSMSFKYPTDNVFLIINSLIAKILSRTDHMYLLDSVITMIREIFVNALKANCKRIYFDKIGKDISNPNEYRNGMREFMPEVMRNLINFKTQILESKLKIIISVEKDDERISIGILNTSKILPVELARINIRKKMADQYNNFSEAYSSFYDPSEGAGLGIILVMFLLKNAGISSDNFHITPVDNGVLTTINIPFVLRKTEITSKIKEKIINEVNTLPTFPEHIIELQSLCRNINVPIETISSKIEIDPPLTADVLKIANSVGFTVGRRINIINEAVMRIGLKNLESILILSASKKILGKRFKKFEKVWTHCNQVAFYARYLALNYGFASEADHVFISGLLHDIGKIVLLSTDQELVDHVSKTVKNRDIRTSTLVEEITIGISHSKIGELIAKKWNFPDYLIDTISNHHTPLTADKNFTHITSIVYLANMMAGIEADHYNFLYIETEILDKFDINDEAVLMGLIEKMKIEYKKYYTS